MKKRKTISDYFKNNTPSTSTQSDTYTLLEESEVDNPLPYSSVSYTTTDSTENSNPGETEPSKSNFQSLLPCNMETSETASTGMNKFSLNFFFLC